MTHVDYGLQVIRAGKGLLCEKPLAINLQQGQILVDAAQAAGTKTAMNFVYGAGNIVDTLQAQLDAAVLGTVSNIEVRYQFPSWPLPNQLSAAAWITRRHEGGMLREMFSHFIYLMQRLFGEVTVHSATIQFPQDESQAEQFAVARLTTNGIPLWLMGGIGGPHAPRESELTIHGSEASLRLSSLSHLSLSKNGAWQPLPRATTAPADAQARLSHLALRLSGKQTPMPTLAEGLAVQAVVERLIEIGTT